MGVSRTIGWKKLVVYFKYVIILLCLSLILVLYLAARTPFSAIFNIMHTEEELKQLADNLNTRRLQRALNYFNSASKLSANAQIPRNLSLVVCVVTMQRSSRIMDAPPNPRYLVQTTAALKQLLHNDVHFENKMLFICNVDEKPQKHEDAVWLQDFIPYVQRHGRSSFHMNFSSVSRKQKHLWDMQRVRRQNEADDYVFCLNSSRAFNSSYVLMLEDDVIPSKDMLVVVDYILRRRLFHLDHSRHEVDEMRSFSYLKLYYPEKWQGYAWEMDRILELFSFGCIGAGIVYVFTLIRAKNDTRQQMCHRIFSFLLGFLSFTLAASLLGRPAIMSLRKLSPQLYRFGPSPRCCTPGMLYNSKVLPALMDFIIQHTELHKDLATYDFTIESGNPGYLLEPNLLHHIGMYSSFFSDYKPPSQFIFDD